MRYAHTVLGVVLIVTVMTAPAAAFSFTDDTLTGPADGYSSAFGSTVDVVHSGQHDHGEFFVSYSDGDLDSVEDWADDDPERTILAWNNDSNRVLVRAPDDDIFGGFFTAGLSLRPFVTQIALNREIQIVEPVDELTAESDYDRPPFSDLAWGGGEFSTSGVAFDEDASTETLGGARAATDLDRLGNGSMDTTIAVLDTGLNVNNTSADRTELYQDRITASKNFISNDSGLASVSTANDHGPWTVAAAAANATNNSYDGACPDCAVAVGKVMNDDGSGDIQQIVAGIEWASDNVSADVISLSLGSPVYSAVLAAEIREALTDGGVSAVVIAAGNGRQQVVHASRYVNSPADTQTQGVVTVAATNTTAPATAGSAFFSSVGPENGVSDLSDGATAGAQVDIAAPGMALSAPVYTQTGARENRSMSGTSMSTPFSAGAIAALIDSESSLKGDPGRVEDRVTETASPIPGAGVTEVGDGMLNGSNLATDDHPDESQFSARTADAVARDAANRQYSQSWAVRVALDAIEGGRV